MGELKLIIEPDADEPGAASPLVEGKIDGKSYRFLLDTGAARSSIIADEYTSTLQAVGTHNSSGVFAPSSEDLITVNQLEVGPISRQNITLTRAKAGPGPTNLIGMDVLQNFSCHFRFDESRVLVDAASPPDDAYPFEALMVDQRFHPHVKVVFGSAEANAVWDTGASITIADMSFVQRYPAFFTEAGASTGTDSTGTQVQTPMFTMSSASMGGHAFPPVRVAGVDLSRINANLETPMDLIIGYSTYSKAHWLFDFLRKRWAISKWLGGS